MKPLPKVFSKENPCSKKDLWLCFRTSRGFREVQVDEAHSIIGVNSPRYLERQGYLIKGEGAGMDTYLLTAAGEAYLTKGIQAYLKNHPAEAGEIPFLSAPSRGRRIRRTARE